MKPYYEEFGITIYHGDCCGVIASLPITVDLAITDPPYNVGKDYGTASDNRPDYDEWVLSVCGLLRQSASEFAVIVPNVNPGGWPVAMKIRAGNAIRKN